MFAFTRNLYFLRYLLGVVKISGDRLPKIELSLENEVIVWDHSSSI